MSKATVGVNLCWLEPGVVGGSEEYSVRLLLALADSPPDDFRLRLYGQQQLFDAYPSLVDNYEVEVAPDIPRSRVARIVLEQSWLPTVCRHDRLIHHGGGVVPTVRSVPCIVTIHDLQPLDLPENFSFAKRLWLSRMIPYSVNVARAVFCPSRFTAKSLTQRFDRAKSKVRIVPHGFSPPAESRLIDSGGLASEAGLTARDEPFVLYPAITYPHKRHIDVVEALGLLRDSGDSALGVVFTGRDGPLRSTVEARAVELGVADRVEWLGRVSEGELAELYQTALAMVMPSEYEGFGNPLLEAMGFGCPIVAANATAIPEVVGDAGLLFPVGDAAKLAAAIAELASDSALRESLASAGLGRSRLFGWTEAGNDLKAAYREALDGPLRAKSIITDTAL